MSSRSVRSLLNPFCSLFCSPHNVRQPKALSGIKILYFKKLAKSLWSVLRLYHKFTDRVAALCARISKDFRSVWIEQANEKLSKCKEIVHVQTVWNALYSLGIKIVSIKSVCESNDPFIFIASCSSCHVENSSIFCRKHMVLERVLKWQSTYTSRAKMQYHWTLILKNFHQGQISPTYAD